ncbi:MAG: ATP-dependent DNA ligase, partial [Flavobacteriaceae bacterium]|nr:ATP-dependent DNA ligase [Flavobacteriaceae bacterium]
MNAFARLIQSLDTTTKTNTKVAMLAEYFNLASDKDKLWAIALFSHRRPKRCLKTSQLKQWAAELAEVPEWLLEASYHIVGDLAETIAHMLPKEANLHNDLSLHQCIAAIMALRTKDDEQKKHFVISQWKSMNFYQKFIFNKIITGGFRIGISQKLMTKALALHTGLDTKLLSLKLMGNWSPENTSFEELIFSENDRFADSRPYPFFLAHSLEEKVLKTEIQHWFIEYKWDGIRAQIIWRNGSFFVWSRGEELITHSFPELESITASLEDDVVIDGEIVAYANSNALDFYALQQRLGRKKPTKALQTKIPIQFIAYDLLEYQGKDLRVLPLQQRRKILDQLMQTVAQDDEIPLQLSERLTFSSWEQAKRTWQNISTPGIEGFMLKECSSTYEVGRVKGHWWKWKKDPYSVDAVMIYAMRGHGRRANLYTDFTFAVWDGDRLVPFAKAYSGLTDQELIEIDR